MRYIQMKDPSHCATRWVYRGGLPGILTFGVGWGGDDHIPCNCTHLGAMQLMFLARAHISMLRN